EFRRVLFRSWPWGPPPSRRYLLATIGFSARLAQNALNHHGSRQGVAARPKCTCMCKMQAQGRPDRFGHRAETLSYLAMWCHCVVRTLIGGKVTQNQPGSGPTALRILLGSQLRKLRESKGVSREEAG